MIIIGIKFEHSTVRLDAEWISHALDSALHRTHAREAPGGSRPQIGSCAREAHQQSICNTSFIW